MTLDLAAPAASACVVRDAGVAAQVINDYYDKDIDAINEPYRPIPSGKISEGQVIAQAWFLLIGGLVIAAELDAYAPPPPASARLDCSRSLLVQARLLLRNALCESRPGPPCAQVAWP